MQIDKNHNQPKTERAITRADKIKLRVELTKKLVADMHPRLSDDGMNYLPSQLTDSIETGFYVRCTSPNNKNFYCKGRGNDKHKLGTFNGKATSITAARKLAKKVKDAIRLGQDPRLVLEEQKSQITLIELIDEFYSDETTDWRKKSKSDFKNRTDIWIKLKAQNKKTQKHVRDNFRYLNLGSKAINKIGLQDAKNLKRGIRGRYQANRVLADIRQALNMAVEKGYIPRNPFVFTERNGILFKEYKRLDKQEAYNETEVKLLRLELSKDICPSRWNQRDWTIQEKQNLIARLAILLSIYVGRRYRSEVLNLKWNDVFLCVDEPYFILHKTKTTNDEDPNIKVYLNSTAKAILRVMNKYKNIRGHCLNIPLSKMKSKYVFPTLTKSKKNHIQDIRKTWDKVCTTAGVRKLAPYMYRHTHWTTLTPDLSWEEKMVLGDWRSTDMVKTYADTNEDKKKRIAAKANQTKLKVSNA